MKALPKVYFWLLCFLIATAAVRGQDSDEEGGDTGGGGEEGGLVQEGGGHAAAGHEGGHAQLSDDGGEGVEGEDEGYETESHSFEPSHHKGFSSVHHSSQRHDDQSSAGTSQHGSSAHHSDEASSQFQHSGHHSGEHSDEHSDKHSDEEYSDEDEGSEGSDGSEESEEHIDHPEVEFEDYSEAEHMRSYKKIAGDMKIYEDEYSVCIREIPDSGYTEDALDECLGKNFIKVTLDLKYIILKVMAKADTKIRHIFINHCYADAGTNEQFSTSCDLLERDIIDMLWTGLDFLSLADLNKSKYLDEWGEMPAETYHKLFEEVSKLSKEFFELLDELDSHKEITILRIKTLIDDRTKLILEEAQNHPDMIEPATVTHRIEISETVDNDDGSGIDFLPATQFQNGSDRRRERKLPLVNQDGDKHNGLRSLNSGSGYNELNGANRQIGSSTRDRFQRNEKFKGSLMDRLGKAARAQAKTPFKNIHTSHYSKISK